MATIYPESDSYSQDPLFEALSKQNGGVTTQVISHDGFAVTYALKWTENMNHQLIIPNCSIIQGFLEEREWTVTYQTYNALMMATFTMSLPSGVHAYPEKHMVDWEEAVCKIYGAVDLGILPDGDIVVPNKHDGTRAFAVQWPQGMNKNLIEPSCSVIKGYLQERGWIVTYKTYEAIMLTIFYLSLPKGVHTYPEKAAKDWKEAIRQVNDVTDLGQVTGEYHAN